MWGEDKIWVWDSAVYSWMNVKEISESYWWTTRVPDTLSKAKELIVNSDKEKMRSTTLNGYRLFSTEMEYGGVKQRWIVVFSEKVFAQEKKTLEKKIERKKEQVEKELWHFFNQDFCSAEREFRFLKDQMFFAIVCSWRTKAPLFHIIFFFMLNQDKKRNMEDNLHIRT